MKKIILSLLTFFTTLCVSAEEADQFDVYLLIGQSNMAGRGELEANDTTDIIEGVWLLDSVGKPVPAVAPLNKFSTDRKDIKLQGYNPGVEFSRIMHKRNGRPVLLVVNARGGSHIRQWQPGGRSGYFDEAVRRTRQAQEFGNLRAILWHQGETDIQKKTPDYANMFHTMISSLRKELDSDSTPVILGQTGRWNWADLNDIDRFNDSVIPMTAKLVPNASYVTNQRLKRRYKDNERDPHFGREAQQELGKRYADAVTPLVDSVYIAKFRGDRQAAISFTFDDGDEDHATLVAPELEKRGFRGTFWVIASITDNGGDAKRPRAKWSQLRKMAQNGHEISNHSFSHGKLVLMNREQIEREVAMNDSAIEHNVGIKPVTFCYPFNATTPLVKEIASRGRVGTRLYQTAVGQEHNKSTIESLDKWLKNVMTTGDWSVTMTHGINNGYDKWNEPEILWELLDKVKCHEDSIWVDTFKEIAAYQEERDNTTISMKSADRGILITTDCRLDKQLFNVPVTIVVKGDWSGKVVKASRSGEFLPLTVSPDRILIEVIPSDEPVMLTIG